MLQVHAYRMVIIIFVIISERIKDTHCKTIYIPRNIWIYSPFHTWAWGRTSGNVTQCYNKWTIRVENFYDIHTNSLLLSIAICTVAFRTYSMPCSNQVHASRKKNLFQVWNKASIHHSYINDIRLRIQAHGPTGTTEWRENHPNRKRIIVMRKSCEKEEERSKVCFFFVQFNEQISDCSIGIDCA